MTKTAIDLYKKAFMTPIRNLSSSKFENLEGEYNEDTHTATCKIAGKDKKLKIKPIVSDGEVYYETTTVLPEGKSVLFRDKEEVTLYIQDFFEGELKAKLKPAKSKNKVKAKADKEKREYICSVCGQTGHNKRTCNVSGHEAV